MTLRPEDQAIVERALLHPDIPNIWRSDLIAAFHAAAEREAGRLEQCRMLGDAVEAAMAQLAALRAKMKEPTDEMVYAAKEAANKVGFDLVGAYCGTEMMRAALIAGNLEVEK